MWLHSLIKSCKLLNDSIRTRLPIQFRFLELLLFEVEREFSMQPYLEVLYKAVFCLAYYRLMRVGEISCSPHNVRAVDIHIASNKDKILILLYSSKTHDESTRPQEINISTSEESGKHHKFFCPFKTLHTYIQIRGNEVLTDEEAFLVYSDKSPLSAANVRKVLQKLINNLKLDPSLYNFKSLRIGRATDLLKFGFNIEIIKRMGQWKSNFVYKYLRPLYKLLIADYIKGIEYIWIIGD